MKLHLLLLVIVFLGMSHNWLARSEVQVAAPKTNEQDETPEFETEANMPIAKAKEILIRLIRERGKPSLKHIQVKSIDDANLRCYAAWDEVTRTSSRLGVVGRNLVKLTGSSPDGQIVVAQGSLGRFFGFLEAQIDLDLPDWWEAMVRRSENFGRSNVFGEPQPGLQLVTGPQDREKEVTFGGFVTGERTRLEGEQLVIETKTQTWKLDAELSRRLQQRLHRIQVFPLQDGDTLIAADNEFGGQFDIALMHDGKVKWMQRVWGQNFVGGGSGLWYQLLDVRATADSVVVFGSGVYSEFVEVFALADGEPKLRFNTQYWDCDPRKGDPVQDRAAGPDALTSRKLGREMYLKLVKTYGDRSMAESAILTERCFGAWDDVTKTTDFLRAGVYTSPRRLTLQEHQSPERFSATLAEMLRTEVPEWWEYALRRPHRSSLQTLANRSQRAVADTKIRIRTVPGAFAEREIVVGGAPRKIRVSFDWTVSRDGPAVIFAGRTKHFKLDAATLERLFPWSATDLLISLTGQDEIACLASGSLGPSSQLALLRDGRLQWIQTVRGLGDIEGFPSGPVEHHTHIISTPTSLIVFGAGLNREYVEAFALKDGKPELQFNSQFWGYIPDDLDRNGVRAD